MYINPYSDIQKSDGQWMKANFHTHAGSGDNCGKYLAEDVISLYKEAGYNVLTLSNHDFFLNTSEYQTKYDLIMFNGFEYSQAKHMLCIDIRNVIYGSHQEVIDECKRQGGFTILCHPNWVNKEYWPWKDIDALRGYTGIEIFNGVIFRLSGSGLATDTWDYLLSQGKLVWGFANDDFHRWYDLARTWNVIYSISNEHVEIKNSILNGNFYASTGLILNEFEFLNNKVTVSASAKDTYMKRNKYLFIGKHGQILSEQENEYGEYKLAGDEMYVRVQVISEHGAMLWTQPIYKEELFLKQSGG